MVHTLKRIYLYTAATFALLATAGVTVRLLYLLLQAAGLRPHYFDPFGDVQYSPPPTTQDIEQWSLIWVIVALLIGLLFGGGHYWLIRRDARSDPEADGGGTRHTFLNGLMALSVLIAVPTAITALSDVDKSIGDVDTALPLAFVLVFGSLFGLVAWERARVPPASRAARVMRQIQENGVQGMLVIIASAVIFNGISNLIGWVLVKNNAITGPGCIYITPLDGSSPPTLAYCPPMPLLSPILTPLFAIAAWGLYAWIGAWNRGAVLQRIVWYAAFGYGVIWLLVGVALGIYTGAGVLFSAPDAWREALYNYLPFIGAVVTGALIASPYFFWLRRLAAWAPERRQAIQQGLLAISTAVSAAYFLVGVILLLQGAFERLVPAGSPIDADGWATAVGALVAGLAYPFLWVALRRDSAPARPGPIIPRRAYVLVVLAAVGIGAVIAAAVTAYQIAAIFLSLPFADALVARRAAVVLLVLGAMALYHLWQLRADLRALHARAAAEQPAPAGAAAPAVPSVPPAAPADQGAETLETILSAVAAGTLDPATAATRIRSLPGHP